MVSSEDKKYIDNIEEQLRLKPQFKQLEGYIQHGNVSTYAHVRGVAEMACSLNRTMFGGSADMEALVYGALLHDFYLYDWHLRKLGELHGYHHPRAAYNNAVKIYNVNDKVGNIILSHMWPLTLRSVPKSREALIVSIADKIVSAKETLFMRG